MNKLVLPISLAVLIIILIAAFGMKKNCVCVNGKCSKCSGFSFDHFFKKKETFTSMASEVPGFYNITTDFPKLSNTTQSDVYYWL